MASVSRALVVLCLLGIGCRQHVDEPAGPPAQIIDLSTSLEALRTDFNAHKGEARFLTLLSPS